MGLYTLGKGSAEELAHFILLQLVSQGLQKPAPLYRWESRGPERNLLTAETTQSDFDQKGI